MNSKHVEKPILDSRKVAQVALKAFFNITEAWGVKNKDQQTLLGEPAESTFYKWKSGNATSLSRDTLERVSYLIGIYKALGLLFPSRQQADAWVNKPNGAYNGKCALDIMLQGSIVNLSDVRRYLDAQRS
jgi:hypothetical protein